MEFQYHTISTDVNSERYVQIFRPPEWRSSVNVWWSSISAGRRCGCQGPASR